MSSHEQGGERDCTRWDIPQIDDRSPAVGGSGGGAHAVQPGYDEGYAQGRAEALAAGQQELQSQVTVLQGLMQKLAEPFVELDAAVETELLSLATIVAEQVIRRELSTDPAIVLSIIRESVALLPVSSRKVSLQLHPADAQLVREHLSAPVDEGHWQIIEDAACPRGGCVVTTGHARIDASVEQQIARIAEAMFDAGDEDPVPA